MAERVKSKGSASTAGRAARGAAERTGKKTTTARKSTARATGTAQTEGEDIIMAKPAETRTTGSRGGAKDAAKAAPGTSGGSRSGTSKTGAAASTRARSGSGTKTAPRTGGAKTAAARSGSGTKTAAGSAATATGAPQKRGRSAAETERIRAALAARREDLREEYEQHLAEIAELQRDRLTDSAGDDQADTGSKTFEREQEISLANSILERINQVERALERLDEGSYGWCERCGSAIPVERLAAFPSATLCVRCKQLEERR
jgi:RNA polymerase-binding protein DksA